MGYLAGNEQRELGKGRHASVAERVNEFRVSLVRNALTEEAGVDRLAKFVEAQAPVYEAVTAELRAGRKTSHWMWFVFPQLAGLGRSDTARRFALESLLEARAFLSHPLLGPRLLACTRLVNALEGRSAHDIFASGDMLVAVTVVGAAARAPGSAILTGLFDLSPSEVRLSQALAGGASLQEAAESCNITAASARTYLNRIFSKTGTHRQGELVALLKSTSPLGGDAAADSPAATKDSDGTWHVSGSVKAQNGFGATRTLHWTCTVDSSGRVTTSAQ